MPENLDSSVKILADDTSLFSVVHDQRMCAERLNSDLQKICDWAHQWKMSFNPDPAKSAVEVYFSHKTEHADVPPLMFNGAIISSRPFQRHLGLFLDSKLTFNHHLSEKITKVNKVIAIIKRLRFSLPRHTLLDIYRAFVRPHLDYGDVLYDNPGNSVFSQRIESVQYNAALAITGCIRGTSREKLYCELGLESLADRRYCRRMLFFYKIFNGQAPSYLTKYLPTQTDVTYSFRSRQPVRHLTVRTERFQNSFFPFCLSQWNKLDCHIRDMPSIASFKRAILQFTRPVPRSVFKCQNRIGIVYLTRLRVGFSHLNEHKFRHNFLDTIDPFCSCRTGVIEDTAQQLITYCIALITIIIVCCFSMISETCMCLYFHTIVLLSVNCCYLAFHSLVIEKTAILLLQSPGTSYLLVDLMDLFSINPFP